MGRDFSAENGETKFRNRNTERDEQDSYKLSSVSFNISGLRPVLFGLGVLASGRVEFEHGVCAPYTKRFGVPRVNAALRRPSRMARCGKIVAKAQVRRCRFRHCGGAHIAKAVVVLLQGT